MTMVEGMTSIELGTIPSQDTTVRDIGGSVDVVMPEEVMETPEERSVSVLRV